MLTVNHLVSKKLEHRAGSLTPTSAKVEKTGLGLLVPLAGRAEGSDRVSKRLRRDILRAKLSKGEQIASCDTTTPPQRRLVSA